MWILKRLKEERKLFYVETFTESGAIASQEVNQAEKWHRRYGHLNEHYLKKVFAKDMVLRVPSGIMGPLPTVEVCIQGKQSATPCPESNNRSEQLIDLVHSDLCGPMRVQSLLYQRILSKK